MARETYVYRNGQLIPKHLAPPRESKGRGLQVIKDIEPYRNIAIDGKIIGGRRQHRDMLRAHGCIEVGNEKQSLPKPPADRPDPRLVADIKRAMGKF